MKVIGMCLIVLTVIAMMSNSSSSSDPYENSGQILFYFLFLGLGVLLWRKGLKKEKAVSPGHSAPNNDVRASVRNEEPTEFEDVSS